MELQKHNIKMPQRRLAIAFSLLCAVCARPSKENGPVIPERVVVGATLPLTGSQPRAGQLKATGLTDLLRGAAAIREGYELAFAEVNKTGGLRMSGKRVPVTLELRDDAGNPTLAAQLAQSLVHEGGASVLLGSYTSLLVPAQAQAAERMQVPYMNVGAAADKIYTQSHRWLFSLLSPSDMLAYGEMRWIDEMQRAGRLPSPARIAIVWERTPLGKAFRSGIVDFATRSETRRRSYVVVFDEGFDTGQKDYAALLQRAKAANADLFLAEAHLGDLITMHGQYRSLGLCHQVIGYGAYGTEKTAAEALGQEAVSYLVSFARWSEAVASPESKKFIEAFQARFHKRPSWLNAVAHEGARALFRAIELAGSVNREAVRQKLASLSMESALPGGRLTFDAEHTSRAPTLVLQNMPDGSAAIIYPNDLAQTSGVAPNPTCGEPHTIRR